MKLIDNLDLSKISEKFTIKKINSEFDYFQSLKIIGNNFDVSVTFEELMSKTKVLLTLTFFKDKEKNIIKKRHQYKYTNVESLQNAINSILLFKNDF